MLQRSEISRFCNCTPPLSSNRFVVFVLHDLPKVSTDVYTHH